VLGANVVMGVLGSRGATPLNPAAEQLHDLVVGKLDGMQWMADYDAEFATAAGPSGRTRDRVQHAVARAMAKDQVFAGRVRSLLESMGMR